MDKKLEKPNYLFEASWEVCNKVGGIYTVLSTRAKTLVKEYKDQIVFIGPDLVDDVNQNLLFSESLTDFSEWKKQFESEENLSIRIGRWNVPGNPLAVLVDFKPLLAKKNDYYAFMWEHFQVNSLHAYGDYDEASMFAIAAGKVVESFHNFYLEEDSRVLFHAHEWMTGMAVLYLQYYVPSIASLFTTHATTIGRSIAGNNKPLYDYMAGYNGDQMATELNVEAKHSIEKQTAHYVDCFTTVSEITNNECSQLLERPVDLVLENGFEDNFVPVGPDFNSKRREARSLMLSVANSLLGSDLTDDTLIVGTSGRYEFRNKGIDVFIEALDRLNHNEKLQKNVLAFIAVPAWVAEPREDLKTRIESGAIYDTPLDRPMLTHWLHNMNKDRTLQMMNHLNMHNDKKDKVKVIFVPCYLDGQDGIFNKEYYDFLIGQDISVYPSYYEPWGYTPLESIAFRVPTITTNLAGFGCWANEVRNNPTITDGVEVVNRTDENYNEVVNKIADVLLEFSFIKKTTLYNIRRKASTISKQALWDLFIENYYEAYDIAMKNAASRYRK
ncbi:MAG: glycogen/starch synthase [Bacteroides sp.]|nr:glycogen/starch synthase [Bacteroides sp.]MDD2645351.1 glycogen/starch synthase [Bacteroides sp.]MDD4054640.1 glycogen/starch synthase [Bacteroides sp.]MDD4719957.1 glycogen/starch synthase [Bacteroides sp.]NLI64488.1 glycosyltransferase [Bacteroidales bacterium]